VNAPGSLIEDDLHGLSFPWPEYRAGVFPMQIIVVSFFGIKKARCTATEAMAGFI
jgi:hypothetical protein